MYEQITIFNWQKDTCKTVESEINATPNFERILSVGDKIGRVVKGECRIATITKVEGRPNHLFYRTMSGSCYMAEEGYRSIEDLKKEAEENRKKYKIIKPKDLKDRLTVKYTTERGQLWAQIGIMEDNGKSLLFWQEAYTYQFLEPYDDLKKLKKEYNKHKKNIESFSSKNMKYVEEEYEMERLYWNESENLYATAEYKNYHF